MKFCHQCGSMLIKSTTAAGEIMFVCHCGFVERGDDDDTLMAEENLRTNESKLKFDVFIQNSTYDLAKNVVLQTCPKCDLNYMTMIQVGVGETTIYTCDCGYRGTYDEYVRDSGSEK